MNNIYIVVSNSSLIGLINEVNEQININSGIPQGGIVVSEGALLQPMIIKIKTGIDEVLPDSIMLMDIAIKQVSRLPFEQDKFLQKMVIRYEYKGEVGELVTDNYDSNSNLASLEKVREHLLAIKNQE